MRSLGLLLGRSVNQRVAVLSYLIEFGSELGVEQADTLKSGAVQGPAGAWSTTNNTGPELKYQC